VGVAVAVNKEASRDLDVVGIGSMVVDRMHRAPRAIGAAEKVILRDLGDGPVQTRIGGVVLNHLGWAAALGLRTGIFGLGAEDENGRLLRAAMDQLGIAHEIDRAGSATSVAEIFVDDAGERAIYMAPAATSETTAERVRAHAAFVARARRVTTEVSQLPLAAARAVLDLARAMGATTAVDLDVPPSDAIASGLGDEAALDAVLRGADLLKPAKSACRELVPGAGSDPLALARALRARFANRAVVITDGEAGCAIAAEGFEGFVRARPVKVVDATGAGDAFLGGLLAALAAELSWEEAARLANACGAACVEQLGAFPEDPMRVRARVLELYPDAARVLRSAPRLVPPPPATSEALASFGVAVAELDALRRRLDPAAYATALALLANARERGARVHVTGVGKPEHLARYAASLFASTGTPAYFLHATEVAHGSAGQIHAGDVVIAISNSGTTAELLAAVAAAREMGSHVIAVTGGLDSPLARAADAALDARVAREGGPLGLAPRASAAAELLVLAALAAGAEHAVGLTRAEYHRRHPAGALGDRSR
jgi:sugar/nucleoside kinase (ribokinase family)/D-arabinose 5-phosphate isomerase GutQ